LQADLPHHRLADGLGDLGHFMVEGVEREQSGAHVSRCDEARKIAVAIGSLNERACGFERVG
jgi:hypothetical protein